MNDQSSYQIAAIADGGAELRVVLRLRWEDIAALGHEASRLASQLNRPVSLDEAASHRLSTRRTFSAPSKDRTEPAPAPSRPALASGSPSPSDSPKERTLGTASATAPVAVVTRPSGDTTAEAARPLDAATHPSLAGAAQDAGRASG
jgi:hypothetical protein